MAINVQHVDRLLQGIHSIPSLPGVVERLSVMLDAHEPDIKEIAETVQADPGLASRLLRLANSPFFGLSRSIGSIDQAIVVLGLSKLYSLVIGLAAAGISRQHNLWQVIDASGFWRHSMAVAQLGAQLSRALDEQKLVCEAFTAGVLHELGHCVFAQIDPHAYQTAVNADALQPLAIRERGLFGVDHAAAGAQLCRHWRLSETLCAAVGEHQLGGAKASSTLSRILRIADSLADIAGFGLSQSRVDVDQFFAFCHDHGLTQETLGRWCQSLHDNITSCEQSFGFELPPWPLAASLPSFRNRKMIVAGEDPQMVELVTLIAASLQCVVVDPVDTCNETFHVRVGVPGTSHTFGLALEIECGTEALNGGVDIDRVRSTLIDALIAMPTPE